MIRKGSEFSGFVKRSGVMPYTIRHGTIYYCLFRHTESGELGDAGGGVKSLETAREAAVREWMEESKGAFKEILEKNPERLDDSVVLVEGKLMAIYLVYVDPSWIEKSVRLFEAEKSRPPIDISDDGAGGLTAQAKKKMRCVEEVSEIVWVDQNTFRRLIYAPISFIELIGSKDELDCKDVIWTKVRNFFKRLKRLEELESRLFDSIPRRELSTISFDIPFSIEETLHLTNPGECVRV
jgi:hypothetical protein